MRMFFRPTERTNDFLQPLDASFCSLYTISRKCGDSCRLDLIMLSQEPRFLQAPCAKFKISCNFADFLLC